MASKRRLGPRCSLNLGSTGGKTRRPNWISAEENELITAILENHKTLFGNFSANIDHDRKKETWKSISDRVNAISNIRRDEKQMQDKYRDLKSRVKKKAFAEFTRLNKTGGGESEIDDPLTIFEEKVHSLTIIELSMVKFYGSTWITGVSSGFDSSAEPILQAINVDTVASQVPESASENLSEPSLLPIESSETHTETSKQRKITTKEAARAKISNNMLCTQNDILTHVRGIDNSLMELLDLKKKKYSALGYL